MNEYEAATGEVPLSIICSGIIMPFTGQRGSGFRSLKIYAEMLYSVMLEATNKTLA